MTYFFIATNILTVIALIVIINRRGRKLRLKKISFSQSVLHSVLKDSLPTNNELMKDRPTQGRNRRQENTMKVVTTTDNKAYWVSNNVFYCVDVIDGYVDPSQAKPIDTDNLTKSDIEKLLFILDQLKNG